MVPRSDRRAGPYRQYRPDRITSRPLSMSTEVNRRATVAERAVRNLRTGCTGARRTVPIPPALGGDRELADRGHRAVTATGGVGRTRPGRGRPRLRGPGATGGQQHHGPPQGGRGPRGRGCRHGRRRRAAPRRAATGRGAPRTAAGAELDRWLQLAPAVRRLRPPSARARPGTDGRPRRVPQRFGARGPWSRRASSTPSSRRSTPSPMETAAWDGR